MRERLLRFMKMGAPVIGLVDCAGLRLQEATDALNAFGEVYLKQSLASGVIPQITAIFGTCGGGAALIPTLTDFTFMTKEGAKLFVNSPNALEENNVVKLDTSTAEYVSENTANVDGVFETEEEVLGTIRSLVEMLPSCNTDTDKQENCTDNINRIIPNLEGFKNDAKAVLMNISDNSFILELKKDFAQDIVTAFIKLNGYAVGCVVNQKDVITTDGAYKAADFVNFCDAFDIPVLTLVNVTGFAATIDEEHTISRALAKLTNAYADATTPKVTVILDKAYGTAYTVMNSKAIGADQIMYEDEISAAADKMAFIKEKKAEYTEALSGAVSAASRGYVDDVIEPDATRKRVIAAFEMLYSKDEMRPYKKHSTI